MRIVFWQNCISPHQMPYISRLIYDERVDEVVVVSDKVSYSNRTQMGWSEDLRRWEDACKIIINPSDEEIEKLMSKRTEDSWHLFSGIRAFEFVFRAFKKSLKCNLKRGIITERPNTFAYGRANGKPLWMHRLRFLIQDRSYAKHIDCVFAMGMEAVNYFKSIYSWKVFSFCYCTEKYDFPMTAVDKELPLRICYVGSLEWWKGLKIFFKACNILLENGTKTFQVTIVGEGAEKDKLKDYCNKNDIRNVEFLGTKPNTEIPHIMMSHDVLVLPSIYDGWGAVVNEALLAGTYVICSTACGASDILSDGRNGIVFKSKEVGELAYVLKDSITRRQEIRSYRHLRKEWAENHLCGMVVASYMADCLVGELPTRPWVL